jgi:hypothetical protein
VKLKINDVTGYYSAPATVAACDARESNEIRIIVHSLINKDASAW